MSHTLNQNAPAQVAAAPAVSANNVVLNNNASLSYNEQVFNVLTTLSNDRVQWEESAYRASNTALYAILQKCYSLDWQLSNAGEGVKAMREGINNYAATKNIKFKSTTPVINRIVHCVFGNVHKTRISTYSLALREAKKRNVPIQEIPSFIEQAGGIQEIRTSKSATYKSQKQKAEIAGATAFQEQLGVASSPELSQLADSDYAEAECVLLATQQVDGTFAIHAVVRGKAALTAALTTYYGETAASTKDQAAKAEAANDSEYRNDIIAAVLGNR